MEKGDSREFIVYLLKNEGPFTISELCKLTKLSRPTIYLHLEVLEKKGLIKREKDVSKKGAPVRITLIKDEVEKKDEEDLLNFLKILEGKGMIPFNKLRELSHESIEKSIHILAKMHGYVDSYVKLTNKGKEFLKERITNETYV